MPRGKHNNRFDIRKVRNPPLSGDPNDPSVRHDMRVPQSIKRRLQRTPKKQLLDILDKNLPKFD